MGRRRKLRFSLPSMPDVEPGIKKWMIVAFVFLVTVLSFLSIFDQAGSFGRFFYSVLKYMFGWGFLIFPIVLLIVLYFLIRNKRYSFDNLNWIGTLILIIGYSTLFYFIANPSEMSEVVGSGSGGGYVGFPLAWVLFRFMGRWAGMVVSFVVTAVGLLFMINGLVHREHLETFKERTGGLFSMFRRGDREDDGEDEDEEVEFEEREIEDGEEEEEEDGEEDGEEEEDSEKKVKPKRRFPKIDMPITLLGNKAGKPTPDDIKRGREVIETTLQNFGIDVEMGDISVGPTVTQYTFRPAEGVKLSRIIGLGNDLALALAAHPIRIEAPIPCKSLVGIEVPNKKIAVVPLRQVLESAEFKERKGNLTIVLGQDVAGKPWVTDLTRLPHLLVAGATNSGKTVCLNSLIISLLYQNQPDELKFILVDPKRVEMPGYNGIPHLLTPVITDVKKTINSLKWTIGEMERRFHVLSNAGKRNIQSYNATHAKDKLPYIIFIIDELADLMSVAGAEVEGAVIRLAQMSRAVGIHLILATQRPSVDIITGLIKANIPGRIAFSVASLTDSRTILDVSGAEKLLGRGDMLYTSAEVSKPRRLQGAYCSDEDIENVVHFLRESSEPDYEDGVTERDTTLGLGGVVMNNGSDSGDADELLGEARELVVEAGKASASYLQRRLKIGYARAARILDLLEERGIIGPADGSKPREILIKDGEQSLSEQADTIIEEGRDFGQPEVEEDDQEEFEEIEEEEDEEVEEEEVEEIEEVEEEEDDSENAEEEEEEIDEDDEGEDKEGENKYQF
jgi:DNA segregation ATPase FtsK/SpoIIIE, S-DNA-T family